MPLDNRPRVQHPAHDPRDGRKDTTTRAKAALAGAVALVAVLAIAIIVAPPSSSGSAAVKPTTPATPTPTRSKAEATQPPSSWKLIFNSKFSGNTLDSSVWDTCYPWLTSPSGCTNFGAKNEEKEWYQPSQVQVHNGTLELVAKHEPTSGVNKAGHPQTYTCRSGMVTSQPGLNFKYGFVQIVTTVPFGKGLWPALWLAASNLKWPPEVDILEHWDSSPVAKVYLHPVSGPRQGGPAYLDEGLGTGYHVFSLYWTASRLTFYMDGRQVLTTKTGIPKQSMYLTINLADKATGANSCNGTMKIKSVKVWRP